jgi:hypothetical protein
MKLHLYSLRKLYSPKHKGYISYREIKEDFEVIEKPSGKDVTDRVKLNFLLWLIKRKLKLAPRGEIQDMLLKYLKEDLSV